MADNDDKKNSGMSFEQLSSFLSLSSSSSCCCFLLLNIFATLLIFFMQESDSGDE